MIELGNEKTDLSNTHGEYTKIEKRFKEMETTISDLKANDVRYKEELAQLIEERDQLTEKMNNSKYDTKGA